MSRPSHADILTLFVFFFFCLFFFFFTLLIITCCKTSNRRWGKIKEKKKVGGGKRKRLMHFLHTLDYAIKDLKQFNYTKYSMYNIIHTVLSMSCTTSLVRCVRVNGFRRRIARQTIIFLIIHVWLFFFCLFFFSIIVSLYIIILYIVVGSSRDRALTRRRRYRDR